MTQAEMLAVEAALDDPLRFRPRVPPCALVIFGANGDLTRRKLLPSLFSLASRRQLPSGFAVLGNSRTPLGDDAFREKMREAAEAAPEAWEEFARCLFYEPGDVHDPHSFERLRGRLEEIERTCHTEGNILFYLATQPSQYELIAAGLGGAGLARGNGWRRIVVEKPIGHDLASAQALNAALHRVFSEPRIFRIDHYLGKETVQNILAFRFGNGIFEPLWNRRYVNHVEITAAEAIGVEGRGAYYEESGALRDMVQNHLLQLMATVGMEPAPAYESDAVRDERGKFLRSIRILQPRETPLNSVAGQYGPARIAGERIPGYREEPGVNPESQTPTYAALTLFVENWRWAGIPFYLRTGKRLPRRVTEISVHFNAAPHTLFENSGDGFGMQPNLLILRIQPEEGISLRFLSKQPGHRMRLRPVSMDFSYGASFGATGPSDYETLLIDAMLGDSMLYIRQDAVEASWRVVQPVLDDWAGRKFEFPNYEAGSWGPAAAVEMLARRGHAWRRP